MYNGYLDRCMSSKIMQEYLKDQNLMVWQALDIIEGSPVSVDIKLEELKKIQESIKGTKNTKDLLLVENSIKRVKLAISLLHYEGIFTLEQAFFNYNSKEPDYDLEKVCESFDKVKKFIQSETVTYPPDICECRWYNIKKWIKNKRGDYIETCVYHMVDDEILYIDIFDTKPVLDIIDMESVENPLLHFSGDLQIPVPFKAGDLLEVDGYPYGPKFRMIILEVGDNEDCCCVQGLARNSENRWESGAVKHGFVSFGYYPKVSSLYSARMFNGELGEDEQILYKVRDYIAGNEVNGKKINEKIYNMDFTATRRLELGTSNLLKGVSDEEIIVIIESLE